jgi:hypothetical protein
MNQLGSNWKCFCIHGLMTSMMLILLIVLLMAWTASNEANRFTYNAGSDTYTKTITPTTSIAEPQLVE